MKKTILKNGHHNSSLHDCGRQVTSVKPHAFALFIIKDEKSALSRLGDRFPSD
jgi:hypothetical protein